MGPSQLDALIAAGGCRCTPDPFRACDTCGRSAVKGLVRGPVISNFEADTIDGKTITKPEVLSFDNLPLDRVWRVRISTDHPSYPYVSIGCDPRRDERIRVFTRRATRLASREGGAISQIAVVVIEISNLKDGTFTRLYLHPDRGPILTTEDLYF